MNNIQRYRMGWVGSDYSNQYQDMVQDPNGDFVRYSSIKQYVEEEKQKPKKKK